MRSFVLIVVLFSLMGCATGEKMSRLKEGMAKSDVIEVLGDPDGFQRSGEYEALNTITGL
ncbi:hypothetical protein KP001_09825 [Geomonas subterranea]|uniref:Uncharacterized protein n=1 Tax=Geomonas subterranea TaxID=2847989 RepID=A0ABX8LM86_9BACT|nr:hypothetical protein [Geomonas subterranea]QXE92788.1 hypothetical protein KP001_09825 [Geomonas subterranea]QXM09109.1 hypothetical protein KP002_19450 [Geomonas subterranea]